jgi:hypothetical protein
VGNHDDRCAKIRAQLENQIVEQARANRIESGRRLVEEQDVRIERPSRAPVPLASASRR